MPQGLEMKWMHRQSGHMDRISQERNISFSWDKALLCWTHEIRILLQICWSRQ